MHVPFCSSYRSFTCMNDGRVSNGGYVSRLQRCGHHPWIAPRRQNQLPWLAGRTESGQTIWHAGTIVRGQHAWRGCYAGACYLSWQ
jgi:hypothetical protein